MIDKIEAEDFPISAEQALKSLELIADRICDNYRSWFTLVVILPRARWFGEQLETLLKKLDAHCIVTTIGTAMRINPEAKNARPDLVVIEPPSLHAIKDRKVVIFDSVGEWGTVSSVAMFLTQMRPTSVEAGSFFSFGPLPKWVNPDYVCFEMDQTHIVSGLGIGYNDEQINRDHLLVEKRVMEDKTNEREQLGNDGSGEREMQADEQ